MNNNRDNRESWLQSAITTLRPAYNRIKLPLPDIIHVSVGFPSVRALSSNNRRIGECWMPQMSQDGNPHIFISPLITSGIKVLDILVHELIHAGGIADHKFNFRRYATELGLVGKMTSTEAGPELLECLNVVLADLGPYPHSGIEPNIRPIKKQTTRQLKAECVDCDAIIRLTQKVVDDPGLPTCACGGIFMLADTEEILDN